MNSPAISRSLAAMVVLFGIVLGQASSFAADPALQLPKLPEASALSAPADQALGSLPPGIGLAVGSPMPAFELTDHLGKPVSTASLRQQGRLLVVFYRGGWCPYCNLQIRQLSDAWPQFRERGVTPVLISADRPDASALTQRGYEIPFPVLSDPDLLAHEAFKVSMQLDQATYVAYQAYGIDVEQWSGRSHHKFAVSSAFLIGKEGKIEWAHASLDYKQRPSVKQLLAIIDKQP